MKFRVRVDIPEMPFRIDRSTPVLSIGSCFSQRIGGRLNELLFDVDVDPFGVLYDPVSIARALKRISNDEEYSLSDLQEREELYFSFDHSTLFSGMDPAQVVIGMNKRLEIAREKLQGEAPVIMITLGTAWAFRHKELNRIVANCHKLPSQLFERELLEVERITDEMADAVTTVRSLAPEARFLFTVSPVRHLRDGLINDQLGKSTLFVALRRITKDVQGSAYFPAFEILQHELRDHRFYAEDMAHPSEQATDYIFQQVEKALLDPSEAAISTELASLNAAMAHRPFDPLSVSHKKFLDKQLERVEEIAKRRPELDLSEYRTYFGSSDKPEE